MALRPFGSGWRKHQGSFGRPADVGAARWSGSLVSGPGDLVSDSPQAVCHGRCEARNVVERSTAMGGRRHADPNRPLPNCVIVKDQMNEQEEKEKATTQGVA